MRPHPFSEARAKFTVDSSPPFFPFFPVEVNFLSPVFLRSARGPSPYLHLAPSMFSDYCFGDLPMNCLRFRL